MTTAAHSPHKILTAELDEEELDASGDRDLPLPMRTARRSGSCVP
jgi:hypothetical protein